MEITLMIGLPEGLNELLLSDGAARDLRTTLCVCCLIHAAYLRSRYMKLKLSKSKPI